MPSIFALTVISRLLAVKYPSLTKMPCNAGFVVFLGTTPLILFSFAASSVFCIFIFQFHSFQNEYGTLPFLQFIRFQFLFCHKLMAEQLLHLFPDIPWNPIELHQLQRYHHVTVGAKPLIYIKAFPLGIRNNGLVYSVRIRMLCLKHNPSAIT